MYREAFRPSILAPQLRASANLGINEEARPEANATQPNRVGSRG